MEESEKKCHFCGVTGVQMTGHGAWNEPMTWTCHRCYWRSFWVGVVVDEHKGEFGPYESIKLAVNDSRKPMQDFIDLESAQVVVMEDGTKCLRYKLKS